MKAELTCRERRRRIENGSSEEHRAPNRRRPKRPAPFRPQQSTRKMEDEMSRSIMANAYGGAFPMRMDFEKQILSRFQRPTGAIPSSMLGLESMTGDLDSFRFEDYINDPRESETARPVDAHHAVEVRLGLS